MPTHWSYVFLAITHWCVTRPQWVKLRHNLSLVKWPCSNSSLGKNFISVSWNNKKYNVWMFSSSTSNCFNECVHVITIMCIKLYARKNTTTCSIWINIYCNITVSLILSVTYVTSIQYNLMRTPNKSLITSKFHYFYDSFYISRIIFTRHY